jgi:hypothetical protein
MANEGLEQSNTRETAEREATGVNKTNNKRAASNKTTGIRTSRRVKTSGIEQVPTEEDLERANTREIGERAAAGASEQDKE